MRRRLLVPDGARPHAPPPHQRDAVERFERANQHRRRRLLRLGHDIHEWMDAVVQIHVGMSGRAVHRRIAFRGTWSGVAGGIGFADIRLDFDDDARGDAGARAVHEHFAEQVGRDHKRWPGVERAPQAHYSFSRSMACLAPRRRRRDRDPSSPPRAQDITLVSREKPSTSATRRRTSAL